MARSKGLLQIFVGVGVSLASFIIDFNAKQPKFLAFLYIGGLVAFYGFIKLILWYLLLRPQENMLTDEKYKIKPKSDKDSDEKIRTTTLNPHEIKKFNKNDSPFHTHHESIIACHSCSTKHYSKANYCQMCGSRFK